MDLSRSSQDISEEMGEGPIGGPSTSRSASQSAADAPALKGQWLESVNSHLPTALITQTSHIANPNSPV